MDYLKEEHKVTGARRQKRRVLYCGISAFVVASFLGIGGNVKDIAKIQIGPTILSCAVYFAVLFVFLEKTVFAARKKKPMLLQRGKYGARKCLLYAAALLFMWLPVFLAYYPGIFAYDVHVQLWGETVTSHHPVVHTAFLNGIYEIGKAMSMSDTRICALMAVIQMIICSIIYALSIGVVCRKRGNRASVWLLLFYGLFPACSFSVVSVTKDAIFAALFVLMVSLLYDLISAKNPRKSTYIGYGVVVALFLLFRNNAIYIVAAWTALLAIVTVIKRLQYKKLILVNAIAVVTYVVINSLLIHATGAYELQEQAAFSVPLQQMLGAAALHEEEIPAKGTGGKIFNFFERDQLGNEIKFNPINADIAKNSIGRQLTNENKSEFISSYIKTGLKYPGDYIRIFLRLTLSAWYPFSYDFAYFYGENNLFAETASPRHAELMPNIKQNSKLPKLKQFLDASWKELGYRDNVIVNVIMAPASYTIALVIMLMYALYKKRKHILVISLLILLCLLCILLSPGILIRYMWPIMFAVPLLGAFVYRPCLNKKALSCKIRKNKL